MTAKRALSNTYLPQRSIYDMRYKVGLYDHRSAVRVLTAEREALGNAVDRVLETHSNAPIISLFDFSYGTGRVTNELTLSYAHRYAAAHRDLRVVAYDVASAGLRKAQESLCSAGFTADESLTWRPQSTKGYIAGHVRKQEPSVTITVTFVHGCEADSPEVMRQLALAANDGNRYHLTTSWYSGLGHIPGQELRREYFHELSEVTSPQGEMALSVSSTGDLIELQPEWAERLAIGATGDFPVEVPGDIVYTTELGQSNFYHVFSTDLNKHMMAITATGQHWWIEGIRYPDEEFASQEAEQANYRRVRAANESKRGRIWNSDDYREFHLVAAFRSSANPPWAGSLPAAGQES